MMKLKIVQAGEPVLRSPARPVSVEEIGSARIRGLIELSPIWTAQPYASHVDD